MVNLIERPRCAVCDSQRAESLCDLPLDHGLIPELFAKLYNHRSDGEFSPGQKFQLYQCKHCEFIWQRWALDAEGMHLLYDKWIDPDESGQKNKTHQLSYYQHLVSDVFFVTLLFPEKKPYQIKVLDFGMGWGGWARVACACGIDVYGAELSKSRVEHAKKVGIPLFNDFNKSPHEFDYINTEQVLEHILDLQNVMGILSGLLKSGGVLRFSVPPVKKELALVKARRWTPSHDAFHPLEHINGFAWKSIHHLARQHDLHVATPGFFIRLATRNPKKSLYVFKRMLSHFFHNNVILIKN